MKRRILLHNKIFFAAVLLLSMLLAQACDRPSKDQTSKQHVKISTRLKWLPGATYIGTIVAREAGLWKEQGLDVDYLPGGFEADPIKLVASGSDDFGITGSEQLLQARSKGIPVVAIFMELRYSPAGWMALKSANIKNPYDFVGRKVGAQYGTNIEPTLDALLAKLHISHEKLIRIPVKYNVAPLFAGQVDVLPVYLNGQPIQARLEGKEVVTINPADYGIRLYGNVYFTSEKMIRERSDVVQRFVNGLTALQRDLEIAILKATIPFVVGRSKLPLGAMTEERWQETKGIMVKYAGLDPSVSVSESYTNSFVNKAHQE
jgi:ABC-type nitrate/sulfonate/bicarbonate transport system substrate-binding protein